MVKKKTELKYLALALHRTIDLSVAGVERRLPLSYAEGMIGAMPVFDTREAAEAFADGTCKVAEICVGRSPHEY